MADQAHTELAGKSAPASAQAHLISLIDRLHDAVAILDGSWRFVYANPMALAISRLTVENLNRETLWELYPGVFESNLGHAYLEAVATGEEREVRDFYYEPLNTTFDLHIFPMEDGVGVHYRDVTQQRTNEDELRASEERYRILTELNPQCLWTADPQGRVLYANQRFLEYIGKDFVPRDGTEYLLCFDPADRDRVLKLWSRSVATGKDYAIDARLLRASDGASRWWHLRALPVRDEDGVIRQWLGVANDIHESRKAEQRLLDQLAEIDRQRREVEAIYRGAPIGMALYDARTLRLLRINDRQAEIFGLPAADAIGKHYDELTAGVTTGRPLILRAAAGEKLLNHQLEGALNTRPGEYRYWSTNYSPVFAEDGAVQAIATATIETTQQKRAETALIQSEKLAAVGRMASSIAHEINNPLESVMNLIYIARQHVVLPEVQTYLDLADQELRRVSSIANQTLRFHKQTTKPQAMQWEDLFASVLSIYEGRLKNAGIAVEIRKRSVSPIVCFDGEIRQVLNNLVGNAIDAMPRGGRLLLRSREATDWRTGRHGSCLTIADTGSGIDPKTQSRIFDAFFTTKGIQGTGLGLWISTEIMQRHHGRIRIRSSRQSAAGHGTVFSLFLPYESVPSPDPAATA